MGTVSFARKCSCQWCAKVRFWSCWPIPYAHLFSSEKWFKETQVSLLQSPANNAFPDWFHGILSKREAEEKLSSRAVGTFLVRVCDNRFGYALSVKQRSGSCAHHMISLLEATGKYVVVGEAKVHPSLASLLQFYAKVNAKLGVLHVALIAHRQASSFIYSIIDPI